MLAEVAQRKTSPNFSQLNQNISTAILQFNVPKASAHIRNRSEVIFFPTPKTIDAIPLKAAKCRQRVTPPGEALRQDLQSFSRDQAELNLATFRAPDDAGATF